MAAMWPLKIELQTRPIAKARPRMGINKNVYTPEKTKNFENMLGWAAKAAMAQHKIGKRLSGPVRVNITAIFRHSNNLGPHTSRPDGDNVGKAVCDSLNSIVYDDDSQVAELFVRKLWGREDLLRIEVAPISNAL